METNQKKNKTIKTLLSVFVLLLLIIGLSYAVWTYSFTGGVNTISSQEVSIDLLESNSEIISITNAIPMTDEEGLAQSDSFAFAVTSKMSQEKVINYIVSMQKLTPDTGYTFLNDNKIKIYIEDFKEEKTIKVVNTGKESHTYSLEWEAVKNTLAKQNAFTYEIKCTGPRCAELGTSQVPVASAKVYQQVLIEAGKTQEYKIIFTYTGTDKGKFSGKLKVYPEIIDKKKQEEQEKKEREKMEQEMKERREKEQKQEAKKNNTKESKTKA